MQLITTARGDAGPEGPGSRNREAAATPTAAAPGTPGPRGAEIEREAPAALAPPMVALKVLLVEDDEVNQRIVLAMLKRLGHRAVLVPNDRGPSIRRSARRSTWC